jgi:predicted aminopeptidase
MRMKWFSTRHSRARRVCPGLLCGLMPMLCGCQPLRDYRQAVAGQMVLLTHQVSLAKLIDAPHTAAALRSRLELV